MQSEFEKTFKQHKDALTTELSKLGKQKQVQLAEWGIEQNKADYQFYFEGAWNVQESKINELQVKLNGAEERALICLKYKDRYRDERDELQKENAALVHVIKTRDIQLENEKHEYDELMSKLVDSRMQNAELQKRVDAVKTLIEEYRDPQTEDKTFRHALSIVAGELEQALKGESNG